MPVTLSSCWLRQSFLTVIRMRSQELAPAPDRRGRGRRCSVTVYRWQELCIHYPVQLREVLRGRRVAMLDQRPVQLGVRVALLLEPSDYLLEHLHLRIVAPRTSVRLACV